MNNTDGMIWYGTGIDNSQLDRDAQKSSQLLNGIGNTAIVEGSRIDNMAKKVALSVGGIFTAQAAGQVVKQIISVTGEFQQLNVAFTTILQSKEKADALMAQMVSLAAHTPFQLQDVASGAKQLIAYGFAAEDVNDTLMRLGNIASGLGLPLDRLTYLYGTTMTQGRLYTRDLMQFTTSGIPMLQGLANLFHKSTQEISSMVVAGKIGFPEVKKVIEQMTDAGGKFFNLMPDMSKTVTGQISNLKDSLTIMFNDIGTSNLGIINSSLAGIGNLITNYKDVGEAIGELVLVYGTYKATIITLNTIQKIQEEMAVQRALAINIETGERIALSTSEALGAVVESRLTGTQLALNNAMMKNPYVIAGVAVAALVLGIYKLATYTTDAEKAQKQFNETVKNSEDGIASERIQIDTMFARLNAAKKGTEEYGAAKKAIMEKYGTYLKGLGDEATALNNVAKAYKTITDRAIESARARALAKATADASDTLSSQQGDVKEKVKKLLDEKFGKDSKQTLKYYYQLVPVIESGQGMNGVNKAFSKLFDKTVIQQNGQFAGASTYVSNELSVLIDKGSKAKKVFDDINTQAEVKFGKAPTPSKTPKKDGTTQEETEADRKKDAAAAKKAQAVLDKAQKEKEDAEKAALDSKRQQENLQNDAIQSSINIMKDGDAKSIKQMDLDHKLKLLAIDRQEEDLLIKMRENAEKERKAKGGKGKFDENSIQLSTTDKNQYGTLRRNENTTYAEKQGEGLDSALKDFQTFHEKRLAIEREFDAKIKTLSDNNQYGKYDKNIAEGEALKKTALDGLDKELTDKEQTFKVWADSITTMGLSQLYNALMAAHAALDMHQGTLTDEEQAVLREKIKSLEEQIRTFKDSKDNGNVIGTEKSSATKSTKEWTGTLKVMNQVNESVRNIISGFDGMDETTKTCLTAATNVAGGIIAMITGITSLSTIGLGAVTAAAKEAAAVEKASVILSVVGAAIAIITTVVNLFTSASKKRKEEAEAEKAAEMQAYLGLISYNEELRQKYEWTKKIGEATLDYIKREGEELAKQSTSGEVDQADLWDKLQNSTYKNGTEKKIKRDWLWFWETQGTVDKWSSLAGKSYEEISKLAAEGKLSTEGEKYYEALKKAKEEGDDLAAKQEEYLESVRETFTGTTYDSLVSSIIDGFKAGKRSAADFADTFESLMQTAVQSSLKLLLDEKLRAWYEDFAIVSENGLTDAEIAELKIKYNKVITDSATDAANLEKITGVSITDSATRTGTSSGIATASQESVDENNGILTNMEGHTYSIMNDFQSLLGITNQMLQHLAGIDTNTGSIDTNTKRLESIESDMGSMKNDMGSVRSGISDINTKGILLKR